MAKVGNIIFLTRMTLWAFRWLGPPLKIFVSVPYAFGMTRARLSNISDYVLFSCFLSSQLDLSAEDDAMELILAECLARPYAELIKSGIPGPSSLKPVRPAALRPSPPSTMGVSPVGLSAAPVGLSQRLRSWERLRLLLLESRSGRRRLQSRFL